FLLILVLAGTACTQDAPRAASNAPAASSSTGASALPRTASGKPDLQGIWQAQGAAAYDLEDHLARHDMPAGMGVVDGFIPYLPAALEQKRANFANRAELDPLNKCYLPGVPRIMTMAFPFHIFQTDAHVAM